MLLSHLGRGFVSMPTAQPGLLVWTLKLMQRQTEGFHGIKGLEPSQMLLQRPDEAFRTAVAFGFAGTHLRRDTVIPQWFQASKAAAASDGHAVHC